MRRLAVLCALAIAAGALALAGCGQEDPGSGLAWDGKPQLYIPKSIPGDRILTGRVKNNSLRPITVKVPDLKLLDRGGKRVKASAQFIQTYMHGVIYPDVKTRDKQPIVEQVRMGNQISLKPGQTAPLMVAWHQPDEGEPVAVDYGQGELEVPPERAATNTTY